MTLLIWLALVVCWTFVTLSNSYEISGIHGCEDCDYGLAILGVASYIFMASAIVVRLLQLEKVVYERGSR